MTKQNLVDLEHEVQQVLEQNFHGKYHSLANMSQDYRRDLVNRHFMFEDCDRFNKGGGGCDFWPTGRGIFLSSDEKFLVWMNEEDHLRIISMDKGGDLNAIYDRSDFFFKKMCEGLLQLCLSVYVYLISQSKRFIDSTSYRFFTVFKSNFIDAIFEFIGW